MPLVSVIVPFLNEARFIRESVDSVLAQTYEDLELLLVDDGSSDESTAVALDYAERLPSRVRYLEHPGHDNRGRSASRNLGLPEARGAYVAFLDADDVWLPQKLADQVSLLEAHPRAGFVCAPAEWWWSWAGPDSRDDEMQDLGVPLDRLVEPPALLRSYLRDEWASLCDVVVRRAVIDRVGGYEDRFRGMFDDQVFHAKLCLAWPAFVSSVCGYRYRQHPESCTARAHAQGEHGATRRAFLEWLEGYLAHEAPRRSPVRRDLRSHLLPIRHPVAARAVGVGRRVERLARDAGRRAGRRALDVPSIWRVAHLVGAAPGPPPVGAARAGALRRLAPVSTHFGFDRGRPIDRYYIESFLERHAEDIGGRVLEVGDSAYTRRFGGGRVTSAEVLNPKAGDPATTIVADLSDGAAEVASESFDCVILTQVLPAIFDGATTLATVHRLLRPGGVALVTANGISQIDTWSAERFGWYWSFTRLSMRRLLEQAFPGGYVGVWAYGNVLAATAFLQGLATEELTREELDHLDPTYELLVAARAVKATAG